MEPTQKAQGKVAGKEWKLEVVEVVREIFYAD